MNYYDTGASDNKFRNLNELKAACKDSFKGDFESMWGYNDHVEKKAKIDELLGELDMNIDSDGCEINIQGNKFKMSTTYGRGQAINKLREIKKKKETEERAKKASCEKDKKKEWKDGKCQDKAS